LNSSTVERRNGDVCICMKHCFSLAVCTELIEFA